MIKKIAIIGLGLIGGSLGMALKKSGLVEKITGIPRREETIQVALQMQAIDEGTTNFKEGIQDAEIIFICTPINLIIPIIEDIAHLIGKNTIVSDVGSSKYQIVVQADKLMPKGAFFVGGHPMAGKEKVKIEQAEENLFENNIWALTPSRKTNQKAMAKIEELLKITKAKIIKVDPKTHDLAVAAISHLPLLIASTLIDTASNLNEVKDQIVTLAASGFKDTTRVASGDPVLAVDMFLTNNKNVLKTLKKFKKQLSKMEKLIKSKDHKKLYDELIKIKQFRDSIYE